MKRILTYCIGLLIGLLSACVEEEMQKPVLGQGEGYLTLQVGAISAEIQAAPLTKATTTIETPEATEFTINIKSGEASISGFPKPYSEMTSPIVLKTGTYTVEAYQGENNALQTAPYFYGSTSVSVKTNENTSATVNVALGNAILKPEVDEALQKHYSEWTLSVKAGSSTEILASKESQRDLYVRQGETVSVSFRGTNLIDGKTSKEAKVTDNTAAGIQYVIQCNPEKLPAFELQTNATAEHTKAEGLLNGTKVLINVASLTGTPTALITGWKAELQNQSGTVVRTYTGNGEPTQDSEAEMAQVSGWPYLPQGTYTLRSALTLKTGETTAESVSSVIVPAPEFTVKASAYTSYNKYLAGDINGANGCDGSTLYAMQAVPTIADALLNNSNYSHTSALTLDGGSENAGDKGSLSWAAHTLNASYTFDGVTKSDSETYHVTGIPSNFNPPTATYWRKNGPVSFENTYARFGKNAVQNPQSIESTPFHIPQNINILLSVHYNVHGATAGTTFTLSLGNDVLFTTTVVFWGKEDITDSKRITMSTSKCQIVCSNSYGSGQTYSEVYYVNVLYQ